MPSGEIAIPSGSIPTGIVVKTVREAVAITLTVPAPVFATYARLRSGVIATDEGSTPTGIGWPSRWLVARLIAWTFSEIAFDTKATGAASALAAATAKTANTAATNAERRKVLSDLPIGAGF